MAQDRRVIMKTSVLPTEQSAYSAVPGSLEEKDMGKATYNKNIIQSSPGRLGGNSVLTDISSSQWNDGWYSDWSPNLFWGDIDANWDDLQKTWDGEVEITTSSTQLSDDLSDLQFLYIKNDGSTTVQISLDGDSTYPLQLSAGASTMFRGYSTNLKLNEVYVKTGSGTSNIEYLIGQ